LHRIQFDSQGWQREDSQAQVAFLAKAFFSSIQYQEEIEKVPHLTFIMNVQNFFPFFGSP
jgi:hypothetical protein